MHILEVMRIPGGKPLPEPLWEALEATEISAAQPDVQPAWHHSCYCWSITSMAAVLVARQSAIRHRQPLVYNQAIDEPQSVDPRTNTTDLLHQLLAVSSLSRTEKKTTRSRPFPSGHAPDTDNYVTAAFCST